MNNCILLADDDDAVRHAVGNALQAEGYDVILAKTAREASHAFLHRWPDLVLLDLSLPDKELNLPDKDGWEAFELMKQLRPWMPVIIITGQPGQFARASRLGAAGLMEKPLDLSLLFLAMARMLETSMRERVKHQMEEWYDDVPPSSSPCCLLETPSGQRPGQPNRT